MRAIGETGASSYIATSRILCERNLEGLWHAQHIRVIVEIGEVE